MDAFENAEAEIRHGIALCDQKFGVEILMAVKPETICMIGGPGTAYCLVGRCDEIVRNRILDLTALPQTSASIAFYVEGSDERTEVCRRQLREYQKDHRKTP